MRTSFLHQRKYWMIYLTLLATGGMSLKVSALSIEMEKRPVSILERMIYINVNSIRERHNLPALEWAADVAEVARRHSQDMAGRGYFAHENPEGELVDDRLKKEGVVFTVSSENIFKCTNYPDVVKQTIEGWMESLGHRANILNKEVNETGVGVYKVKGKNEYYITQNFIKRAIRFIPSTSRLSDERIDKIFTILSDNIAKTTQKRRKLSSSLLKKEIYRNFKSSGFQVEKDLLIRGFLKGEPVLKLRVDLVVDRGLIINFSDEELQTASQTFNRFIHLQGYSAVILIRMAPHQIEYLLLRIEDKKE